LAQVPPSEEPVEKISPSLFLIRKPLPIGSGVTEIALQFLDLLGAIFWMRDPCESIEIGYGIGKRLKFLGDRWVSEVHPKLPGQYGPLYFPSSIGLVECFLCGGLALSELHGKNKLQNLVADGFNQGCLDFKFLLVVLPAAGNPRHHIP